MRPRLLAIPIVALAIAASCSPSHPRPAVASAEAREDIPEPPPLPEPVLVELERSILADAGGRVLEATAWKITQKPTHFDFVTEKLPLTHDERILLATNGFAVRAGDTYASWASALHAICTTDLPLYIPAAAISRQVEPLARGSLPSYMRSDAYAALRAARPVTTMAPPPPSSARDCESTEPWPWLEPAPDVYARVAATAPTPEAKRIAESLVAIARHELEGRELTYEERRFLSYIVSDKEGWYAQLGRDANVKLTLGFFVVGTNGPARLMVGPVPAT